MFINNIIANAFIIYVKTVVLGKNIFKCGCFPPFNNMPEFIKNVS